MESAVGASVGGAIVLERTGKGLLDYVNLLYCYVGLQGGVMVSVGGLGRISVG